MDDSGEGERIFRLQMTHYFSQIQPAAMFEDRVTVNDFVSLAHSVRAGATRSPKKRNKRLLTLLGVSPSTNVEQGLLHHYFLACLFWHFSLVDFQKPTTVGEAVTATPLPAVFAKPARYFFQQLVSGKVLQRHGRSSFDLVRPFVAALMATLQMINEIIESDKLLFTAAWNYGEFIKVVESCASYTAPCRRTTWVLGLRRRLAGTAVSTPIKAPLAKKTRRAERYGSRQTRRRQRRSCQADDEWQNCV
jgi:hypothetical protein